VRSFDLLSKNFDIFDYRHGRLNTFFNRVSGSTNYAASSTPWHTGCMATVKNPLLGLTGGLMVEVQSAEGL
jgi:hypothetical protein